MEWQPIETAPKDGRSLLLTDESIPTRDVEYQICFVGSWSATVNDWADDYNLSRGLSGEDFIITHWMPPPEPPKEP